ncbi:HNH endonuclease [Paraburkholderia graminis]
MTALTQETLQSVLHYDPVTGVFTYLSGSRYKEPGQEAGYIKSQGYREIHVAGKNYYAHRLAFLYMTGAFPLQYVDHINGEKLDNRWCNLRNASHAENMCNRRVSKNNSTGYRGVYLNKDTQKYSAYVNVDGHRHQLGKFDTAQEAGEVAALARKKYHGAYAN